MCELEDRAVKGESHHLRERIIVERKPGRFCEACANDAFQELHLEPDHEVSPKVHVCITALTHAPPIHAQATGRTVPL